ncbi:helix-turn-helix domain-containing protein [Nonomuraea sp. FMUSA5-5]|uniref:Helix-turn-helix domain-containing protein n=1 Tax=Nonomuraea composti TaxID=2720023 RepID=A0ABX1BEE1_9ACTN|nr:helix-turn-helix domain-containing protein [Nonomuraea sp. FMUSA5-5]NJP94769.1 helix-turn-helix domain-containing protein [Nonomuraea sp. FMUSA5-5]
MGFERVVAYAPSGVTALALGIVSGVFGAGAGRPAFETVICAERPGELRTDLGLRLQVGHGLAALRGADLVLVLPGDSFRAEPAAAVLDALHCAHAAGAVVAAHCTGVFALAAAGLLDGLEATTHWRYAGELAGRHPAVRVRPDALYLDHGSVATGAGAAAGLDLCLHLLRREHGAALANRVARDLVTPPHRAGGQAQYISTPMPGDGDDGRLTEVIAWARANLDRRVSVAELAARALMSRRTFARAFKSATGASPHAWLLAQRLDRAEHLLETTDLPVEEVARRVGYGSATVLRERFVARRGVAPRDYRRAFRQLH